MSTNWHTEQSAAKKKRILASQPTDGDSVLEPLLDKKPQNSSALFTSKLLFPLSRPTLLYKTRILIGVTRDSKQRKTTWCQNPPYVVLHLQVVLSGAYMHLG